MNAIFTCLTLVVASVVSSLAAQSALLPTVNFTLRDSNNDGLADLVDSTPNNSGFDGFLTVNASGQEDRVFAEFNLANRPLGWSGTALQFSSSSSFLGSVPSSTLQISYYTGNGLVNLSDWTIPFTPITNVTITGALNQPFNIDVTSVVSSFGNSGFLGFRFELIAPTYNQKFLNASTIALTDVPEPATSLLVLLGLGVYMAHKIYTKQTKAAKI